MTTDRLRAILAALGWSQRGLAAILGCPDTLTRGWARGRSPVPPAVASWLERLAVAHEAEPLPPGWRRDH